MVWRLFASSMTVNGVNHICTHAAAAALIVIYVDCKYCDPLKSGFQDQNFIGSPADYSPLLKTLADRKPKGDAHERLVETPTSM